MNDFNKIYSGKGKGQDLYKKAKSLIPGGAQLLGKRAELYLPELWPSYYSKAKGCHIWDLDGNKFLDCTMVGIGTSVLGYADRDVCKAVSKAVNLGSLTTLNCPEEVELAELLIELHPWADMVRYARTGGEAVAVAIRIARAATGKDKIAFCGYHGWHDWYLSANLNGKDCLSQHLLPALNPLGVPKNLDGTLLPFRYNCIGDLNKIVELHGDELAAIIMEPSRENGPMPGFLEEISMMSRKIGAVLIFDEITSGWRMATSGIHMIYNVNPDIATFGKAISNGVPMAAIIGRRNVMESAQKTFISSTYWTDRIGPSAALACLAKHRKLDVGKYLTEIGEIVQNGWKEAAANADLDIEVLEIPPLATFKIKCNNWPAILTLFIQEMLDRKILASNRFYATYSHSKTNIDQYLTTCCDIFKLIKHTIDNNDVKNKLRGPVKHMGFEPVK